ncbi:transposase [Streptomyces sp. SID335]|nr:transposase [Streptomyces sp. SID335]MYZ19236.1 transposase [Streptomyces sp. SID337]NDZ89457.1 transposase [Streptomyces sp. SID10115]NEA05075.1 transposase [Streptomyces sp. SID10116]NEB49091.1 transposase [Streptomyces sp. SID339]
MLPVPAPKLVRADRGVADRQALSGILFVLHTGIQWKYLPQELGFGSGMTCWRRLADWKKADVWDQLHVLLLEKVRAKNQLDWEERAVLDSSHVRTARRSLKSGPSPAPEFVRSQGSRRSVPTALMDGPVWANSSASRRSRTRTDHPRPSLAPETLTGCPFQPSPTLAAAHQFAASVQLRVPPITLPRHQLRSPR